jgi:hypothetical protein
MKNIQAQYQDLLEGKMSKSNFMRNVRMQFPQHVSPVSSFDDSIKILKGKRILSENRVEELSPATRRAAYDNALSTAANIDQDADYLGYRRKLRQAGTFGYGLDPAMKEKLDSLFSDTDYSIKVIKTPNEITVKLHKKSDGNKVVEVNIKKDGYKVKQFDVKEDAILNKLHTAIKDIQASGELGESLNEAKKPEGVYGHNPNAEMDEYRGIDHLNYYQVYKGIQFELAKMPEITDENYIKARKKVVDTIMKDPDAYKDLQLANFKAVKEMDKDLEMKDVKKNNLTDKPNEMKVVSKDAKANTQDTLEKKEKKKSKTAKIPVMTQTPKGKLEAFATPGKEKVLKEGLKGKFDSEDGIYTYDHLVKTDSPTGKDLQVVLAAIKKDKEELAKKGKKAKMVKGGTVPYLELTSTVKALKEHILDELTRPNEVREDINKGSRVKKKGLEGYDAAQVGNVIEFDGDTATVQWDNDKVEHVQANILTKKDIPKHPEAAEKFGQIPDSPFVKKEEKSEEDKKKGLKEKIMKTVKELLFRDKRTKAVQSFQPGDPAMKDPEFNRVFQKA